MTEKEFEKRIKDKFGKRYDVTFPHTAGEYRCGIRIAFAKGYGTDRDSPDADHEKTVAFIEERTDDLMDVAMLGRIKEDNIVSYLIGSGYTVTKV